MGRWVDTISDVEIHSKICQISQTESSVENAGLINDEVKHIFEPLPNFH